MTSDIERTQAKDLYQGRVFGVKRSSFQKNSGRISVVRSVELVFTMPSCRIGSFQSRLSLLTRRRFTTFLTQDLEHAVTAGSHSKLRTKISDTVARLIELPSMKQYIEVKSERDINVHNNETNNVNSESDAS